MKTVAFICSANLCRSPMAQAIFAAESKRRGLAVRALSAGLFADFEGMTVIRAARLMCDKYHTPMPQFVATYFPNIDLNHTSRIFVMERSHVSLLLTETSLAPERVCLLGDFDPLHRGPEIEDPTGKEIDAFERCYLRLRDCIISYLDTTQDFKQPT